MSDEIEKAAERMAEYLLHEEDWPVREMANGHYAIDSHVFGVNMHLLAKAALAERSEREQALREALKESSVYLAFAQESAKHDALDELIERNRALLQKEKPR